MKIELNRAKVKNHVPNQTILDLKDGKGPEGIWGFAEYPDEVGDWHVVVNEDPISRFVFRIVNGGKSLSGVTMLNKYEMVYIGPCKISIDLL